MVPQHHETHSKIGGLIREAVFGFNDGLVSTVALIAGLSGALIDHSIVLLAGVAEMFAGAISMGLGTYLGTKSENEVYRSELEREKWEMENKPDVEREEIRQIYRERGFRGELLEKVTEVITSDKKVWLKVMMHEELGFTKEAIQDPVKHGFTMGAAFIVGALFPLTPYLFLEHPKTFSISIIVSGIALLAVGGLKTYFTNRPVWKSALETLFIGIIAAGISFGVGVLLGN